MKAKDRPRLDIDALQDLANAKVFARGEAYHRDGRVVILSIVLRERQRQFHTAAAVVTENRMPPRRFRRSR